MTISALSGLIVTKLQGISGVPSGQVFAYEPITAPATYPYITVTFSDDTSDFADTSRNYIRYTFKIRIYQERLEMGPQTAETTMMSLVDGIIAAFDADPTLGNQLTNGYAKPIPSVWGYISSPDANVRVAEIKYLTYFAQ